MTDPTVRNHKTPSAYGTWESPLDAHTLAGGAVRLSELRVAGSVVGWLEGRPANGGAVTVVQRQDSTDVSDLTGPEFNARTLVHEYGGGAWHPHDGGAIVSSLADQRLWLVPHGSEPTALTVEGSRIQSIRYADPSPIGATGWFAYVRERHEGETEPTNDIVAIHTETGTVVDLASGHDFYSSPRANATGTQLAYIAWDHPNMPWDDTAVHLIDIVASNDEVAAVNDQVVAKTAAWQQPAWSPDGVLHAVGDPDGWWNIHSFDEQGHRAIGPQSSEFGVPSWGFANSTYCWSAHGTLWAVAITGGVAELGRILAGRFEALDTGYVEFDRIEPYLSGIATIGSSPVSSPAVIAVDDTGAVTVLHAPTSDALDAADVSVAEAIEFATNEGRVAHAFWYPPHNASQADDSDALPPVVVLSHGGPTGNASNALNLGIQYWTTRGIGVVDVNYGGSTGFGTEYRNRLRNTWGITDVIDCVRAAEHLAAAGLADPDRLAIKGGSAGGFTTLCALTFHDTFAVGVSRYGVADLETLARDTHKFESRYLDLLVGPWPDASETYQARSPIHHTAHLDRPMIILQGSDDPIVPPSQAEQMVEALAAAKVSHAYVLFEGESHGFRAADNIAAALEAELSFLGQILGFTPAGNIVPVEITQY
jgi:dipeptidyl aminopeptidase/acylaminoacyl peptidase